MIYTLDVVISIYNRTNKYECLKALLSVTKKQSTKPNNVIIVCDGPGCSDVISYIKENYDNSVNLIIYSYEDNKGPGFARDFAIRKSKSDLIAIMDSDDLSVPERFQLQINEFKNNAYLSLCGGFIEEYDFNLNSLEKTIRVVPIEHEHIKKNIKIKSPFNNVTVMFKKDAYLISGGYPHKRSSEDYALWGRFISSGFITKNISKSLVSVNFDPSLLDRRSGFKFFVDDYSTQKELLLYGLITKNIFIRNFLLYYAFRFLPKKVIKILYFKVLRK